MEGDEKVKIESLILEKILKIEVGLPSLNMREAGLKGHILDLYSINHVPTFVRRKIYYNPENIAFTALKEELNGHIGHLLFEDMLYFIGENEHPLKNVRVTEDIQKLFPDKPIISPKSVLELIRSETRIDHGASANVQFFHEKIGSEHYVAFKTIDQISPESELFADYGGTYQAEILHKVYDKKYPLILDIERKKLMKILVKYRYIILFK